MGYKQGTVMKGKEILTCLQAAMMQAMTQHGMPATTANMVSRDITDQLSKLAAGQNIYFPLSTDFSPDEKALAYYQQYLQGKPLTELVNETGASLQWVYKQISEGRACLARPAEFRTDSEPSIMVTGHELVASLAAALYMGLDAQESPVKNAVKLILAIMHEINHAWVNVHGYFPWGKKEEKWARDQEIYARFIRNEIAISGIVQEYGVSLQWAYRIIESVRNKLKQAREGHANVNDSSAQDIGGLKETLAHSLSRHGIPTENAKQAAELAWKAVGQIYGGQCFFFAKTIPPTINASTQAIDTDYQQGLSLTGIVSKHGVSLAWVFYALFAADLERQKEFEQDLAAKRERNHARWKRES